MPTIPQLMLPLLTCKARFILLLLLALGVQLCVFQKSACAQALVSVGAPAGPVTGGNVYSGSVTLSAAAPAGGISVALSSNKVDVEVPATVLVPAGSTYAYFNIQTYTVSATVTATITATYNAVTKTTNTILKQTEVTNIQLDILSPYLVRPGSTTTGLIILSQYAVFGPVNVTLSSNDARVTVPTTVTVPKGEYTAGFTMTTNTSFTANATVTLTASYGGINKTMSFTVETGAGPVSVTMNPTSVLGGASSVATITLDKNAPTGGQVVQLGGPPYSVTVPAGTSTANVTITTAQTDRDKTIFASANRLEAQALLQITPRSPNLGVYGGNASAKLYWDSIPNVESYNVKRSGSVNGTYATVGTVADVPDTRLFFTNTGLTNGTTYYYKVCGVHNSVEGPLSPAISIVPGSVTAPNSMVATAREGAISLSCSPTSTYTSINFYRSTTSGGPYEMIASAGTYRTTDINVEPGRTYYYVAKTVLGVAESPYSTQVSAVADPWDIAPPDVLPTNNRIRLTIDNYLFPSYMTGPGGLSTSDSITTSIYWSSQSQGPFTLRRSYNFSAANMSTNYVDLGLTPGTTHYYQVQQSAQMPDGTTITTPMSDVVSATTSSSAFVAPQNLQASLISGQVWLSWPTSVGAASYKIKRSLVAGGPYTQIGTSIAPRYIDSTIDYGQYYYVVSAVSSTNTDSANSNQAAIQNVYYAATVTGVSWSSTIPWSGTSTIQCEGILWPQGTQVVARNTEISLFSALATDWDLQTLTFSDGATMPQSMSDSCTYNWTATGGTFTYGSSGRKIVWKAPNTAGTYLIKLNVDDLGNANKLAAESGDRDDPVYGYADQPAKFSISISVP